MNPIVHKVIFAAPRTAEVATEPSRDLAPREVRIATIVTGISRGTEMNFYRGDAVFFDKTYDAELCLFRMGSEASMSYPIEFGYENIGRIAEVGSGVSEFATGRTVVTYQPHRSEVIIDLDSRDVLIGDMSPVLPLPDGVPAEHGVFLPLLGVAFNAILDARIIQTETVVVFGAGVVGLLMLQLAKRAGAGAVYVVEPTPARRKVAADLGASRVFDPSDGCDIAVAIRELTAGRGADVAIEASGVYAGCRKRSASSATAAAWSPQAGCPARASA